MRNTNYSGLLTLAGILSLGGQVTSAHAQVTEIFNYTGGLQTFVVPTGVTSLDVTLWGAGGGAEYTIPNGGGGAYVRGNLTVTPNANLAVLVGGSGYVTGFGGGGEGGGGVGYLRGGGRSGILLSGVDLVDAGGGGGASESFNGGDAGVGTGHNGGGLVAGEVGSGAGQSAGGIGGFGGGGNGSQFQGGSGSANYASGGGGGGYYGGGGGGGDNISYDTGGGGGSSYTTDAAFELTSSQDAGGGYAGGQDDPNYESGLNIGDGTGTISGGGNYVYIGNGEVVISYNLPASSTPEPGSVALLVASGACAVGTVIRRRRLTR